MFRLGLLSFMIILFLSGYTDAGEWIETNGPWRGLPKNFAVCGKIIFCINMSNLYVSNDYGNSWIISESAKTYEGSIASLDVIDNSLFISTFTSPKGYTVYRSSDTGQTWLPVYESNEEIRGICENNGVYYAITQMLPFEEGCTLLNSTDAGATWNVVNNSIDTCVTKLDIRALTACDNNLIISGNRTLLISNDKGITWVSKATDIPNTEFTSLASQDKTVFAGSLNGLFISYDEGQTWEQVNGISETDSIYSLQIRDSQIIAGSVGKVYLSTDNGISWKGMRCGLTDSPVHSLLKCENKIFAANYSGGVNVSIDNGENWVLTGIGVFPPVSITSFEEIDKVIYAGTFDLGVFRTSDRGEVWEGVSTGLPPDRINDLAVKDDMLFAATRSGIYVLKKDKTDWALLFKKYEPIDSLDVFTTPHPITVQSMAITSTFLFASLSDTSLYRSSDMGTTWEKCGNQSDGLIITKLLATPSRLFALTDTSGILRSDDDGEHWEVITSGFHPVNFFEHDGPILYTGVAGGILISEDNGENWHKLEVDSPYKNIQTFSADENLMAVVVNEPSEFQGDILLSDDRGNTWTSIKTDNSSFAEAFIPWEYKTGLFVHEGSVYFTNAPSKPDIVWRYTYSVDSNKSIYSKNTPSKQFPIKLRIGQSYQKSSLLRFILECSLSCYATMQIYDLSGKKIDTVLSEKIVLGTTIINWQPKLLNNGRYIITLTTGYDNQNEIINYFR